LLLYHHFFLQLDFCCPGDNPQETLAGLAAIGKPLRSPGNMQAYRADQPKWQAPEKRTNPTVSINQGHDENHACCDTPTVKTQAEKCLSQQISQQFFSIRLEDY